MGNGGMTRTADPLVSTSPTTDRSWNARCAVCGTAVPHARAFVASVDDRGTRVDLPVCVRPACRSRVTTLPPAVACAECRRPLHTVAARLEGRCGTVECRAVQVRLAAAAENEAARAAARARLGAVAEVIRDEHATADVPVVMLPSTDVRTFPMMIAPRTPTLARLPRRRARALRAHLRSVAAEAAAERATTIPGPPATFAPEEAALHGAGCAACGGRCCRSGRNHAYVDVVTIRRWLAAHPGSGPRDAVAAYAAYVPRTSVEESCVYASLAGCVLPRAMRSDTCNGYLCEGLVELHTVYAKRAAEGRPLRRAFLAVIEEDAVARWGCADAGEAARAPTRVASGSEATA